MRRRTLAMLIFGASSLTAQPMSLWAQQPAAATNTGPQPTGFCYSSNPLPACRTYLIFEMTGAVRLAGTTRPYATGPLYAGCVGPGCRSEDLPSYLAWDLGMMRSVDSRYALGGSLQVGGSEDGVRLAVRARSRLFLSRNSVLDLAAGPLAVRIGNAAQPRETYGLTADGALGIRRIGTVVLGTDVTNDHGRMATAMHAGVRLESMPAVVASALVAAGGIMTLVALSHAN